MSKISRRRILQGALGAGAVAAIGVPLSVAEATLPKDERVKRPEFIEYGTIWWDTREARAKVWDGAQWCAFGVMIEFDEASGEGLFMFADDVGRALGI